MSTIIVQHHPQTIVVGTTAGGQTVTAAPAATGTGSANNTLTFYDEPLSTLVIQKYVEGTTTPIKGVRFLVTDNTGAAVGITDGEYVTDEKGQIVLKELEPGMVITAKEVKAADGFVLDGEPKSITIKSGDVQTLTFYNQRQGSLRIVKLDSVSGERIAGATFELRYADGRYVDDNGGRTSSNGRYVTNRYGEINITGITGTIVVTEIEAPEGYSIREADRTQTVTVNPDDRQTLRFYNDPIGGVEIIKVSEADRSKRLGNVTFEIRRMDGGLVETVTTDKNGRVYAALDAGDYYLTETIGARSYELDPTPHYFTVKNGKTTTLTVTNKPLCGIEIFKFDSTTGAGIYGAVFTLYDAGHNPLGEYTSNQSGYVSIEGLTQPGAYYLKEQSCKGYLVDEQLKQIKVSAGETTRINWANTPITGQIQIWKFAAENNLITGTQAGMPLQGAVYEIVNARTGAAVSQIVSDARGVAASAPLPLDRYLVREIAAPAFWQLSGQTFDLTLEFSGQIIKVSDYDKPAVLGVTVGKTGLREVLAGDKMSYRLSVANTSNVALESFYLHDTLPYDAASASLLTTGTYSQRLNYRVLYKTNFGEYRELASNLLTTNNYAFQLSGLPLMAGEVVTDLYFDFGTVPAGFQSVTQPTLTVTASPTAVNGYQIINRADAGGTYCGTWQTANAGWVTMVRNLTKPVPLPKTGY